VEKKLVTEFKKLIGDDLVSGNLADCEAYSFVSNGIDFDTKPPDLVVLPRSAEDVVKIVKLARKKGLPITPRGKGTAVLGCNVAQRGGVMIDMSLMNKTISIDKDNMVAVVEAGCVVNDFFNLLDQKNLMYPIRPWFDPQMQIGAWIACNGNGDYSKTYGTVGETVVGLEVVLPSGDLVRLGSWTNENEFGPFMRYSGGPDLIGLFSGSIGTLGIITKAAVRLIDKPKYKIYGAFGWEREDTEGVARATHAFLRSSNINNYSIHNYWTLRGAIKSGAVSLSPTTYFVADIMAFANTKKEAKIKEEEIVSIGSNYGANLGSETCQGTHGPPLYIINAGHYKLERSVPKRKSSGIAWCQFYFYAPVLKFSQWWNFFEKKVNDYGFMDKNRGPCLFGWAIPPEALAPFPTFGYRAGDPDEVSRMKEAFDDIMGGLLKMGCTPYSLGAFIPAEQQRETLGSSYRVYQILKKALDPKGLLNPGQI
jgi:FAD/FMN-containing dehydrogenase